MIKYDWIRSNRKTMSIQIKTDGKVIVRTPYGISKYQVQMFIEEKKQWIEKHLKEISERQMSNKILSEGKAEGSSKSFVCDSGTCRVFCRDDECYLWENYDTRTENKMGKLQ